MDVPKIRQRPVPKPRFRLRRLSPTLLTGDEIRQTGSNLVDGIAVFVLPGYIVAPYVDVQLVFEPWPIWFFTQIIIYWNWIWTYVLLVNVTVKCIR